MKFKLVSDLAQRLIFPKGLQRLPSAKRAVVEAQSKATESVRSPLRSALDRFNPVTPVLQRTLNKDLEMTVAAPTRRGVLAQVFRPKPQSAADTLPIARQTMAHVAANANSGPFKVTRTLHIDNGFEIIGYPHWNGFSLPLRTRVKMRLGAASDGSWSVWPDKVSVWGISSDKLRDIVKQALRSESKLQADGDRFRILIP